MYSSSTCFKRGQYFKDKDNTIQTLHATNAFAVPYVDEGTEYN